MRYQLLPYLYSTAWQVTDNDESYLRALVYDFPNDKRVWDMNDEFLFGRSILATPIVSPQYTEEKIVREDAYSGWDKKEAKESPLANVDFTQGKTTTKYLPKGCGWYDYWTEKYYRGGQDVTIETTFDQGPMFVRAGSILPLAPVVQYAEERKWDNLDIIVYPGADATFTLYEDEGDNYNYEKGQYATIRFTWDNQKKQLTIGKQEGQYPGMLKQRKFNVRIAGQEAIKTVEYNGEEIKL